MNHDVEILRWSGIWKNGNEARVGVRLKDGRDALLVAYASHEVSEKHIRYTLIIQGTDHDSDFVIPAELEQKIENKLFGEGRTPGSRTLKDLQLF
jgi:hypothetical protein